MMNGFSSFTLTHEFLITLFIVDIIYIHEISKVEYNLSIEEGP